MIKPTRAREDEVIIETEDAPLEGMLALPAGTSRLVVFAHGSGSSRFSPRNRQVAQYLNDKGFGTLLFDLLTPRENEADQVSRAYRFDISLLGRRLEGTVDWLARQEVLEDLGLGLFGASTGAAAALIAAADQSDRIQAIVSRGGRPDLAGNALAKVRAPTLLIVGGLDLQVIELNERAAAQLACEHRVTIIPGATHLFEEQGKLEEVCRLAADWFERYL